MSTKSWREVRQGRPLDEDQVEREKLEIELSLLRRQLGASQAQLAEALGTSQSNVSQLERSNDQLLSSIARYVHALGGKLRVSAVFGDTTFTLLDDLRDGSSPS
jgi:transcriptional regulator with XRE-family HTH domain